MNGTLWKKIQEMEIQISQVWNPDLKGRMAVILDGLKVQLREREGTPEASMVDEDESNGEQDEEEREEREECQESSSVRVKRLGYDAHHLIHGRRLENENGGCESRV